MKTLIVKPTTKKDFQLLIDILKKMKIPSKIVIDKKKKKELNLLKQIEKGLTEVKKIQEGKLPKKTLTEMLNGK